MPLYRCSSQQRQTLGEHFAELLTIPETVANGQAILQFLRKVNEIFKDITIWGLTSHYRLVVLKEDDWRSDWLVIISCRGEKEFDFEYLLPLEMAPWPNAYVKGTAHSIEEAVKYLNPASAQASSAVGTGPVRFGPLAIIEEK